MNKLISLLDSFTEQVGRAIAWLTLAMVLLSFTVVVLRYVFNIGSIAMQESVLYLHALIFMAGAAYTFKHDGHVRVDIFYQKMSVKVQAIVNLFGVLFLLLPVVLFIFYISFDYVVLSWRIKEQSPEAGGLSILYLNKTLLLVLPIALFIQALAEILRNICIIQQPLSQHSAHLSRHKNSTGEA